MKDREKPRESGGKKKHGDFSKFSKKKSSPSKSFSRKLSKPHKTSKPTNERFSDSEKPKFAKKPSDSDAEKFVKRHAKKPASKPANDGLVRLNKYIAHSGVCSRREADTLIASGAVTVNGEIVTELGTKIKPTDKVQLGSQTLASETIRFVLLNKPKGYISTTDDPEKRRTVMQLVEGACKERIYPVGRLDRNTTGLLLFTNDGELAKKLTHPSSKVKKIYHVQTDQPVSVAHMEQIATGLNLEDGFIKPDAVDYVGDGKDRKQVGMELHSGKNRIVRRIF
jgi:23S rRNA pseudouridine2605 synthase